MTTTPTPTRHPNIHTLPTTDPAALAAVAATGATLAVADPKLATRLGLPPTAPLPAGRLRDCVAVEAAAAGVPEVAVLFTVLALLDTSLAPMLPPALAAVPMPPTVIVGTEVQCAAVLAAAEAVVASSRGTA